MFRSASIAAFFLMVSAGTAAADDLSALPPADSASAWQEDEGLGAAMTDAELDERARAGVDVRVGVARERRRRVSRHARPGRAQSRAAGP